MGNVPHDGDEGPRCVVRAHGKCLQPVVQSVDLARPVRTLRDDGGDEGGDLTDVGGVGEDETGDAVLEVEVVDDVALRITLDVCW